MSLQAQQMAFNQQIVHEMRRQQMQNELVRPTQPLQFRHPIMGPVLLPGNSPAYSNLVGEYPSGAGRPCLDGGKHKMNKGLRFLEGASKVALPIAMGALGAYMGGPVGGLAGVATGRAVAEELPSGGQRKKGGRRSSKVGKASERIGMKLGKVAESLGEKVATAMFERGVKSATSSGDNPAPVVQGAGRNVGDKDKGKSVKRGAWVEHVKAYRAKAEKAGKMISYKEALQQAGATYKGAKVKPAKKAESKWLLEAKKYAIDKEITLKQAKIDFKPIYLAKVKAEREKKKKAKK